MITGMASTVGGSFRVETRLVGGGRSHLILGDLVAV